MPTPFWTAAQRLSASAFSIFDMVQIGTTNDRSWMAGSANADVEVSTRTSKPSVLSQPRMIEAQRSGSWPGQPPHTIIALRMLVTPLVDLSGRQAGRHHGGPPHRPAWVLPPPFVSRNLKGLHGFERMQRQRTAGTMRPARRDRGRQVGDADRPELAIDIAMGVGNGLPIAARLGHGHLAAELVGIGHQKAALRAVDFDRYVFVLGHIEAHDNRNDGAICELQ